MSLCKPSNDEKLATLPLSLVLFVVIYLCLCRYISLCKSSSDEEVATLLLSSFICPDLSLSTYRVCCVSLVMMREWPPRSSLVLSICIA